MMKRIFMIVWLIIALAIACSAAGEKEPWDCPDCGKTGITDNFCGGCGHTAPWMDSSPVDVGDILQFGHYEQDNNKNNGPEEIEWIVLDYDEADSKALLLSWYGLDAKPYNMENSAVSWERCTLRTWLNNEFLKKAFSSKEQSAILITNVDNSSSQGYSGWNTDGGNNTQDQIFLLSCAEANRYLGVMYDDMHNAKSRVAPTAYAIAHRSSLTEEYKTSDGKPVGWWWLRSPGMDQDIAACVVSDGGLYNFYVGSDKGIIRPALWLDLDAAFN